MRAIYLLAVYLTAIADLPLMSGLTEDAKRGLVFDTVEGRIIEAEAEGGVDASAVRDFYRESLPELGWTAAPGAAALNFTRKAERLTISIQDEKSGTTRVHFTLRPEPKEKP